MVRPQPWREDPSPSRQSVIDLPLDFWLEEKQPRFTSASRTYLISCDSGEMKEPLIRLESVVGRILDSDRRQDPKGRTLSRQCVDPRVGICFFKKKNWLVDCVTKPVLGLVPPPRLRDGAHVRNRSPRTSIFGTEATLMCCWLKPLLPREPRSTQQGLTTPEGICGPSSTLRPGNRCAEEGKTVLPHGARSKQS